MDLIQHHAATGPRATSAIPTPAKYPSPIDAAPAIHACSIRLSDPLSPVGPPNRNFSTKLLVPQFKPRGHTHYWKVDSTQSPQEYCVTRNSNQPWVPPRCNLASTITPHHHSPAFRALLSAVAFVRNYHPTSDNDTERLQHSAPTANHSEINARTPPNASCHA